MKKHYKTGIHQTGTSFKRRDQKRDALLPGKRKTAWGTVYYEYRKNRSDLKLGI